MTTEAAHNTERFTPSQSPVPFVRDEYTGLIPDENVALFALSEYHGLTPGKIRDLLIEHELPSVALRSLTPPALFGDTHEQELKQAAYYVDNLLGYGIHVDTLFGDQYPPQLRGIHDYPPVIYWQGHHQQGDHQSVAIIGTRTPSPTAQGVARDIATILAQNKIPIVSGLARGIDTIAQQTSLDHGNRTIGVIGTGLRKCYPPENADLQQIIAHDHLLMSQFRASAPPTKTSFPMRNVVMSGFSALSIIIEAGEHSGTRAQARAASNHGRYILITRTVHDTTTWGRALVARGLASIITSAQDTLRQVQDAFTMYTDDSSALITI